MAADDKGRHAEHPSEIPPKGWKEVALRVYRQTTEDHVSLIAAGIAFYTLLALFPGIAASLAIAGLATEPAIIVKRMEALGQVLPDQAAEIIFNQAQSVAGSREGGLGLAAIVGILLAFYSASRGVSSLIEGLNVAYDEKEKRGFFKLNLVIFAFTLFLIVGLFAALLATVAVPAILAVLHLGAALKIIVFIAQWAVLLVMVTLALAFIYRFGVSREAAKWRWVTPGAVIACLLWIAGSALLAVYVGNFASYNETFGSLAGVVVLLMWLWLSAYSVLLGAEIDAEMEMQTACDSTTGLPEPRGQRGAVKADYLPGEDVPVSAGVGGRERA